MIQSALKMLLPGTSRYAEDNPAAGEFSSYVLALIITMLVRLILFICIHALFVRLYQPASFSQHALLVTVPLGFYLCVEMAAFQEKYEKALLATKVKSHLQARVSNQEKQLEARVNELMDMVKDLEAK